LSCDKKVTAGAFQNVIIYFFKKVAQKKENKMFKFFTIIFVGVIILVGCAVKTPLAKVENQSFLNDKVLIIGSFSRPIGKNYFRLSSIDIVNINGNEELKNTIFIQGKENIMNIKNPYEFNDDYTYSNTKGSVFSKLIPPGEYFLTMFSTGHPQLLYFSNYSIKLNLKAGEIVYIGDIKYIPTKMSKPAPIHGNIVALGAKCVISNQLKRDFNIFKKYYPNNFFKQQAIKVLDTTVSFDLNGYSNTASQLVVPAVVNSVIIPSM
jgi:hypothetical protein